MSRPVTPQVQQPGTPAKIPHEKIAMRAYEKWVKRGKPAAGNPEQDWLEAETELKTEFGRGNPAQQQHSTPQQQPANTSSNASRR